MYWNNRVFRRYDSRDESYYTIHEVYYNEDDSIMGYVEKEAGPFGDTVDELRQTLNWMLESCDKPPIDHKELEAYFEAEREKHKDDPAEVYERYDSVEELLAALDEDDEDE